MAALASRYTEPELAVINSYFKGATEVLHEQTARLKRKREES
jgi:hypothetical protein